MLIKALIIFLYIDESYVDFLTEMKPKFRLNVCNLCVVWLLLPKIDR